MRRLATTVLSTLALLWLVALPALATEGQSAGEGAPVEGGGDNAFLYLFLFGVVWGLIVFLDAGSDAPGDEGAHSDVHH